MTNCKYFFIGLFLLFDLAANAQNTVSFNVGGDLDKFYPVVFEDKDWYNGKATEIAIGRSDVHQNASWTGSLISSFKFHTIRYGHGAAFVDADIKQTANGLSNVSFIAGYQHANGQNGSLDFIVWLKGNTSYQVSSQISQAPRIYDGIQNSLPFQEENGLAHSYKTTVESYVNSSGTSIAGELYVNGGGLTHINGDLGLGTKDTKGYKLAVNGKIRAKEIKVEAANWPDYVFDEGYEVGKLEALESYIKANKHLPEIPSAKEVAADGVALGEMNKLLLKKIEELTLHLIEKDKEITALKTGMNLIYKHLNINPK